MVTRIQDFATFSKLYEFQSKDGSAIIIGDSQTPIIASKSKTAGLIGNDPSEKNLWGGGVGVKWLLEALKKYPTNFRTKDVVIVIGTNGAFSKNDDIPMLMKELRRAFPAARFHVIQGSWGWGGNKSVTTNQVKDYYDRFKMEGANVIEPPIGSVYDPHNSSLPIYNEIVAALDKAIQGQDQFVQTTDSKTGQSVISRPDDPYKYMVSNDHWLAKKDDQSNWYEITGRDFKPEFQVSINTLDTEYPKLRTQNAPKRA